MEIRGLAFLPLLWAAWPLLGLGALVTLTVISGHDTYPYISDTGKELPESVVYTVVFMVMSILGAGVASIQYRFMIIRSEPSEKRYIIGQRILYAMGWIVCIGTAVNAVYSVKTNPTAHRIGAGLAFVVGAIYNLCQAACLYKRSFSSRRMCHIRLAEALLTIVALLIFAVGMTAYFTQPCSSYCVWILTRTGMVAEYIGFAGLTLYQGTNYTDFQASASLLQSFLFYIKGETIRGYSRMEKSPDINDLGSIYSCLAHNHPKLMKTVPDCPQLRGQGVCDKTCCPGQPVGHDHMPSAANNILRA